MLSDRGVTDGAGASPTRAGDPTRTDPSPPRVVVIGAGFAGLFATRRLRGAAVEVTLIDRTNYHLFQPLLYQVATGILSEGDVAPATRDVLRRQANARVLLGEVGAVDLDGHTVTISTLGRDTVVPYDFLVVAAGSSQSYFGHDEFAAHAPGLKSIDDALEVRERIFGSFEVAELEPDADRRSALLTFALVGAGATGVEMAGQLAELSRQSLRGNYHSIDPALARIVLLEAGPRILPGFAETLSKRAGDRLTQMGVEIRTSSMVTGVDADGIDVRGGDGTTWRLPAVTKIWTAGVQASPLGRQRAQLSGADFTRHGQVKVLADCSLPAHPEVFVIGDLMALDSLPGLAEVAIQSGVHAASVIRHRVAGDQSQRDFHYVDLGSLAVISRRYAVGQRGRIHVWGNAGWLIWLCIHLVFLTGFKNRASALLSWILTFFGRTRYQRAIALDRIPGREPEDRRPEREPQDHEPRSPAG